VTFVSCRAYRAEVKMPLMSDPTADSATFSEREIALNVWLQNHVGVNEVRRIVREDPDSILISKFEPGFAPGLHTMLDELPQLFDSAEIAIAYSAVASADESATALRVDVWDQAMRRLLATLSAQRGIEDDRQALIRVGIDSVRAILDSALWSVPLISDDYEPQAGEIAAFRDVTSSMSPDHDLFTRHYGLFEDLDVVNHCPGAPFARLMLGQAWQVCTDIAPPE
jgi:hypothetical protein